MKTLFLEIKAYVAIRVTDDTELEEIQQDLGIETLSSENVVQDYKIVEVKEVIPPTLSQPRRTSVLECLIIKR